MNEEFIGALKEIVKEKGISEDLLFTTIDDALVAAYKKNYANTGANVQNVRVSMNRENGEIHVYSQKKVAETVIDGILTVAGIVTTNVDIDVAPPVNAGDTITVTRETVTITDSSIGYPISGPKTTDRITITDINGNITYQRCNTY